MRRSHDHLAATDRRPARLTFSTPSAREGLMKHSFPLGQSSDPSAPSLYVCLSGPTLHIHSSSIASYSGGSTLKSLFPFRFVALTQLFPPAPPRIGRTRHD